MLPPSEVVPALSHALRYSSATDLRCSSVIVCRARVTVGSSFSFPFGIRIAADTAGQSGPRGGRGVTPELRRVLEDAFPGEEARYFAPMSVGGSPSAADSGAAAILDGTKTATSSARWDWPDGRVPFPGALSVLLDGRGRARAVVETERVEAVPFGSVDEDFARAYGEGDRTLGW